MINQKIGVILILTALTACKSGPDQPESEPADAPRFVENWTSLATIDREPEWFKDAKFGIYFHWGPYSVPAFQTEWYPRWMYVPNKEGWGAGIYEHHRDTYGPVSEFNYHDFIPMFTAEHFNAAEWAGLFRRAGARFAGLVAQHHDGYAMWGSDINPWNARDTGPQTDILGGLFKALKEEDMKTIATFHHAKLLQRYARDTANWAGNSPDPGPDSHFPYHPDYITSTTDPKLRLLYGNIPEAEFHDYWLGQVKEVVDNYAPDIIWFDSWLDAIPEDYRQKVVAHHFNTATGRGQAPIAAYKQEDLPADVGILDIEQGGKEGLSEDYWLTDITISYGSWSYTEGQTYKPPALVLRNMIDVWSKRGIVLLNISPRADGTIGEDQREVLTALGDWLQSHGEAVYGTRAYKTFGYGDAEIEAGHFGGQSATIEYSAGDIRFTRSKDGQQLYVFTLGMPKAEASWQLRTPLEKAVKSVKVLGSDTELQWSVSEGLLTLETPESGAMNEIATVFRIEFE